MRTNTSKNSIKRKIDGICDVVQMNPEEYETIMEDIRPSLE